MSNPLTAYTYFDLSNNICPITNSTFVYGTLGPTKNVLNSSSGVYYTASGALYGSLNVVNVSQGNTNLVGFKPFTTQNGFTYQTIQATQSGIYRIKTTLSFTGASLNTSSGVFYRFSNSVNSNVSITLNPTSNQSISNLSTNQILSLGYLTAYNTLSSGYPFATTTFNLSNSVYNPFITLTPAYSTPTAFLNNGISVIEQILYLQVGVPLYFNIAVSNNSSGFLDASGNFELEMLYASPNTSVPSVPSYITTLMNYKYNNFPIMNSNFLYGLLGPCNWTANGSTAQSTTYGSLDISSNGLYGNTQLVSLFNYGLDKGYSSTPPTNRYTIQVTQSGMYRLKTTLSFTGSGLPSGNVGISLVYTTISCKNTQLSGQLLINLNSNTSSYNFNTTSAYVSLGYLYSGNGAGINFSTNSGNTNPIAVLNSTTTNSTTFTNNGISLFESILYLSNTTPLYFNISPGGSSTYYLNATGNFMLELLSLTDNPNITNINASTNSGILFSNGYNYIEFYPNTTTTVGTATVGTATITFPSNISLGYLLVGGGGGGGGGYVGAGSAKYFAGGGGGGGSAISGSISGTTFNISVGYYGLGQTGANFGLNGQNSSIGTTTTPNIATAYGGGGGGAYNSGTSQGGGKWNPVPDPTGSGTPYNAVNGGQGYYYISAQSASIPFSGSNGYIISFPFKTYSIGGAGGGGGDTNNYAYAGNGGSNNTGGAGGPTVSGGNINGSGYGTGGGGAISENNPYSPQGSYDTTGGNGGNGIVVLYWQ